MADPSPTDTAQQNRTRLDPEQAAKVLRAAHALCQGAHVTQDSIARELNVSQSQVSRLLRLAREVRWLVDRPLFIPPEPGDPYFEIWREVESQFVLSKRLEQKFRAYYGGPLRRVVVVDGLGETFFQGAADALLSFLSEMDPQCGAISSLGVTWGRNIRYVIQALRQLVPEPIRPPDRPITLVPLCGEPFQDREDPQTFNSSALTWELHQVVNARGSPAPLSIAGVYAFIPQRYRGQAETILDFYRLGSAYAAIFPKDGGLAQSLDAVLTAIGVPGERYPGVFLRERLALGDLAPDDMPSILGDVSGILIPRKSAKRRIAAKVEQLNRRWTGVKKEHLTHCAARAERGPGVMIVAQSEDRAALIHRCCREEKMFNTLLISRVLAEAIEHLVDSDAPVE
jgi:hypothetical protein